MYRAFIAATVLGTLSSLGVAQAPFQLGFGSPPAANVTAAVLWPAFTVRIEDQQGGLVPGATDPVQVVLASGSGTLHGTLTRAAQGGIATFDDLWYDAIEAVTIMVSSPGLVGIGSTAVDVGNILHVGPTAPYTTIMGAVNALVWTVSGLEIHVAAGLYQESVFVPGVVIEGADRETTIVGGFVEYGSGGTVRGFTIQGGGIDVWSGGLVVEDCVVQGNAGEAVHLFGSITMRDSVIVNNTGGIGFDDSGAGSLFERCRIEGNTSYGVVGNTGAPVPGYPAVFVGCVIAGNGADGAWASGGGFAFESCIIAGNALDGLRGSVQLMNCTVWGNGSNGIDFDYHGGSVSNSVVWSNGGAAIAGSSAWTQVTYSDVQGGFVGTGNIDAPPLLADPLNGDFHLLLGSPCIDAGDSTVMGLPLIDLDGELRIAGASVDMGADEFSGISLSLTQPLGPGSLELRTRFAAPGDLHFVAFTFDPANTTSPGTGWWGGLHISFSELVAEYLWGAPFLGCIDATGEAGFLAPHSVSALPSPVYGVVRTFDPTGIGLTATSNLVSLLVQ